MPKREYPWGDRIPKGIVGLLFTIKSLLFAKHQIFLLAANRPHSRCQKERVREKSRVSQTVFFDMFSHCWTKICLTERIVFYSLLTGHMRDTKRRGFLRRPNPMRYGCARKFEQNTFSQEHMHFYFLFESGRWLPASESPWGGRVPRGASLLSYFPVRFFLDNAALPLNATSN